MAAVDCYTRVGRCVCDFSVKCGDMYGSEGTVAQGADWHSDADEIRGKLCSFIARIVTQD